MTWAEFKKILKELTLMVDLTVGVPFTGCEKYMAENNIIATREDEAIGIAVGAKLAGKNPLVYMQNSGLGNSVDIITSLLKPYNINIDIIVQKRITPEHHAFMGKIQDDLVKLLEYDTIRSC